MMDTLLILIPALPLAAFLLLAFGGRWFGPRSHLPVVFAVAGSCLCSLLLLLQVQSAAAHVGEESGSSGPIGYEHITAPIWTWVDVKDAYQPKLPAAAVAHQDKAPNSNSPAPASNNFSIEIVQRADPLTAFMLAMVTFISTLVAIYASGYMHGDPGYPRFFCYIALFVFSMTMLVSVSNFLLLYVFWEAVGLCSYLLVGFWYEKPSAAAAGKKAFLVNRVGDFGFAIGIFLIWTTYGTLNFHDSWSTAALQSSTQTIAGVLGQSRLVHPEMFAGGGVAVAISLLLMSGACGKSAQFPLHVWLPDAMEGPTPVSALIHAATMVTAGVYMVARCTPLFLAAAGTPWFTIGGQAVDAPMVVATIGGFSAILAALIAVTQNDLKRVLAYSTISQLGYMFLSLGTASLVGIIAGMFHLFTHAFFKALLFLGAGSVMHAMGGVIDMRRIGGLRRLMPITYVTFLIGGLALAGFPPLSGFWSKDQIFDAVKEKADHAAGLSHSVYTGLYWIALFTAGLTAFYTFRALFMTFFGEERIPHEAGHHAHESPRSMTTPLVILSVFAALVGGYYGLTHGILNFLRLTPSLAYLGAPEAGAGTLNWGVAMTSSLVVVVGIGLAAFLYLGDRSQADWLTRRLHWLYAVSYGKFFIDPIYQAFVVWPLRMLAAISYWFDRFIIDGFVNLVGAIPSVIGAGLRSLQSGMVQFYALAMILGLLVLIGALVLWPLG